MSYTKVLFDINGTETSTKKYLAKLINNTNIRYLKYYTFQLILINRYEVISLLPGTKSFVPIECNPCVLNVGSNSLTKT